MSEQKGLQDISIKDVSFTITQDYYPQPVALDTEFSYTITLNNSLGVDTKNIVVTDIIDLGFEYQSSSATNSANQPQYNNVNRTLTCQVGTLSNTATCVITVTVKAIKAGAIKNIAEVSGETDETTPNPINENYELTIKVVNVPGDIDTILGVVGPETGGSIKGISDVIGTGEVGHTISGDVKNLLGVVGTETGASIKGISDTIGSPIPGETILGDIKSLFGVVGTETGGSIKGISDVIGTGEVGHTVSGDIKTILGVVGTETGAMENLTTIEEDTNDRVKAIERSITHIVNPGVYNLTTGVVIKDYNAASIVAAVDRKIGSTSIVQVTVKLIDHTQNQPQVIYSKTIDVTKHNNVFVLGAPPAEYEVLFECIEDGVYVWTAARTNGVFDSVNRNNLISSNTFKHTDLIIVEPQA